MYFSFTTLSTIGFGDYYPVSNTERVAIELLLLFGVALFSYIMGELMAMITKVHNLDRVVWYEKELDQFF